MSHKLGAAFSIVCVLAASPARKAQGPEIIRAGNPALMATRMPLTTDTVDNYVLSNGVRELAGTTVRAITQPQAGAESVYEIRTIHSTVRGDTSVTIMVVRTQDLSLVFHRVKAPRDSAAVTASRTHLTGWVVLPNQPVILLDRSLEYPVFGVEGQVPWLLPLLPLAAGYGVVVPHFSQWQGGEQWDTVTVVGSERVTIGRQSFDCWKLDTGPLGPPGYRMYRWVDKGSRRVVQSVLRAAVDGREYWSYLRS